MNFFSFQWMVDFVVGQGYFLIFLMMVVEGPTITTAAAFAASLGLFNVWTILLLSIAGDLVGDILHFSIGRIIRRPLIDKFGHKFGLHKKAVAKLENLLQNNLGKAMLFIKMTPLASVGLFSAGALKVKVHRFLFYSLLITLPRAIFFTALGFSFGWAVSTVLKYFAWGEYALLFIILVPIVSYFFFKKTTKKFLARIS